MEFKLRDFVQKQQNAKVFFIIAASLVGTAIMLSVMGLTHIQEIRDLKKNGVLSTAIVTDHYTESRKSGNSRYTAYCLALSFTYLELPPINESTCQSNQEFWEKHPVGGKLEVLHSPTNPSNLIVGNIAPEEGVVSYAFFFISSIELCFAIFFLLKGIKINREKIYLNQHSG